VNLNLLAAARALGGTLQKRTIRCPGPGHSTADRSLSVTFEDNAPGGFVVHSFAGDDPIECRDYVRQKLGFEPFKPGNNGNGKAAQDAFERMATRARESDANSNNEPVAIYDYTDRDGTLLYQVLRYEPKDFRQRQPDGNGGWIPKGHERSVLYRWTDLVKYSDATVFICEGEKDADHLATLGHYATTVDGRGKWTQECVEALRDRDVLILEDNDDAGRKKALAAARALHGTAKTIRIVRLPGLAEKGDVSDWLDADPSHADRLAEVCFETALWEPQTAGAGMWLDMSTWDHESVPARQWAIHNRVPLRQANLFSGEGGTGKSILELTKNVAHVTGKDWLGSMPELGPAFYIGAEDEEDEIHRRLAAVAKHCGVTFKELIDGGLYVKCMLGQDATLCAATGKSGKIEVTDLYRQLYEAAGDIRPKNISIDTLSRAFAGDEINRVQVYGFAMHMQALAMAANGSVTVLSHPSLQGIYAPGGYLSPSVHPRSDYGQSGARTARDRGPHGL
jgi:AAA domain